MLRGKAPRRDRAPAPAQHVDLVRSGLAHDLIHRGADILGGVVGIRKKAVLHLAGASEAGDIQPPYRVSLAGKILHKTVILVVHVEFMGRIRHAVDQEDLPLRTCPL